MRTLSIAVLVALGGLLSGQPAGRDVRLTIHEGTSMAAALSPDGRTIVIDLLGALWTLSADGGAAKRILEDGYDAHLPAWSPDGRQIAFQAYRSSTWAIWTVGVDGSGLRQVTTEPVRRSRAALVPGWRADRVCLRSQRQLRRLDDHPCHGCFAAADDERGERLSAGVAAGRPIDRLCIRSSRSPRCVRRDDRRGAHRALARLRRRGPLAVAESGRRHCRGGRRRRALDGRGEGHRRSIRGRLSVPTAVDLADRAALHRGRQDQEAAGGRRPGTRDRIFGGRGVHASGLHSQAPRLYAARAAAGPRHHASRDLA